MEGFTYAMIEAGVPSLRQWDGREGRPYEPPPAPNDQA